jgi:hypothetical protein
MVNRTILAPVDTGCYQYWCNSTWDGIACDHRSSESDCVHTWSQKQCSWDNRTQRCFSNNQIPAANCSQWRSPVASNFAGTRTHFDHLIVTSARWWNGSKHTTWQQNLAGQMARMFRRWPAAVNQSGPGWSLPGFTPADSFQNYWEAEVLSPQYGSVATATRRNNSSGGGGSGVVSGGGDVKMILALFPALFGTSDGALLRKWCQQRGWPLVWALGGNGVSGYGAWTNGEAVYPLNQRILDPSSLQSSGVGANLSLDIAQARRVTDRVWSALSLHRTPDEAFKQWKLLYHNISAGFTLWPLSGTSCKDVECIGVTENNEDCVC